MLNIAPKVRFDMWKLTFKAKQKKKTLTKDNKSFLSYYSTIRLWGHMLLQAEFIRLCVHATLKNFSVQHCNDVNSYFFLQYRCHGLEFFTCVPKNKQVIRKRSRINVDVDFIWAIRHTIGWRISCHFFLQSEVKPLPTVTRSHAFSRASRHLHVITSSFDWLTVFSVSFVTG